MVRLCRELGCEQYEALPAKAQVIGDLAPVMRTSSEDVLYLIRELAKALVGRKQDRARLRRVLTTMKDRRATHESWKMAAEYFFGCLLANYDVQDKLEDELEKSLSYREQG